MPYTINGIGTTYYGKGNLEVHTGRCESCLRTVQLRSYDTRLWFVVLFIPILPLGRRRVIDDCPVCGAHRHLPLARSRQRPGEAFDGARQAAVGLPAPLEAEPDLARNRRFRKLVRPSEQRAQPGRPVLPPVPLLRSKAMRLPAAAAVIVVGGLWLNHYLSAHKVHIVNGLAGKVQVAIEGHDPVTVSPDGVETLRLSEGRHVAALTHPCGHRETIHFTVPGGLSRRFFNRPTNVLNAFGAAVVAWEKTLYTADRAPPEGREPEFRAHLGEDFVSFDDVDYEFDEFPSTIRTEQEGPFHKTRVVLHKAKPADILRSPVAEELPAEAVLRYAEAHLRARGDDRDLLWTYFARTVGSKHTERLVSFLRERLGDRPVPVEWHRCYQSVRDRVDGGKGLVAEYDKLLEAEPDNSALLYLRGRLGAGNEESLGWLGKALAADARNAYAWMGKAYHHHSRAEFAAARQAASEASRLDPDNPWLAPMLYDIRFAAGELAALEAEARQAVRDKAEDFGQWFRLMAVRVAKGDRAAARAAREDLARVLKERSDDDAAAWTFLTDMFLLSAQGELREAADLAAGDPGRPNAASMAHYVCLALGRLDEAEKWAGRLPQLTWQQRLVGSVAANVAGDAQRAGAERAKARQRLMLGGAAERTAAALLADAAGAGVAPEDLAMEPADKALVLVALVQAGAEARLLALAEKLNYYPGAQQQVVAKAIGVLRSRRP